MAKHIIMEILEELGLNVEVIRMTEVWESLPIHNTPSPLTHTLPLSLSHLRCLTNAKNPTNPTLYIAHNS